MCNPVTTNHPDKLLAKGVIDGFEWEVTANGIGFRCGYVREAGPAKDCGFESRRGHCPSIPLDMRRA